MAANAVPCLVPGSVEHRTQPYVSASKVAALFGRHRFLSLAQLVAMKRGAEDEPAGPQAAVGEALEDAVREWFGDQHGVSVVKPVRSWVAGRLSASPDGLIVGTCADIVEVKCTSKGTGALPEHWVDQAQAQMACTGAERVHFAVLWGGDLRIEPSIVYRDEQAIEAIHAAADAFFASLDLGLEPEPLHPPKPADEAFELDDDLAAILAEAQAASAEESAARTRARNAKTRLALAVGANARPPGNRLDLIHDGRPLARLVVRRGRSSLSTEALSAAHPDIDLAAYRVAGDPYVQLEKIR
jgi:predicted phage-related endonuclease